MFSEAFFCQGAAFAAPCLLVTNDGRFLRTSSRCVVSYNEARKLIRDDSERTRLFGLPEALASLSNNVNVAFNMTRDVLENQVVPPWFAEGEVDIRRER